MSERDNGLGDPPLRGSPEGEHSAKGRPSVPPSALGWMSWAVGRTRRSWRTLADSGHPWRQVRIIACLLVGVAVGLAVLLAARRGDFRSYRDQMTTYVANATQHDSSGAAPFTCAQLRTMLEQDPERWDDALREQDLALGGLRPSQQRLRSEPGMAAVVYERDSGGEITLHIPVAEEDGELLMCPRADALFGDP